MNIAVLPCLFWCAMYMVPVLLEISFHYCFIRYCIICCSCSKAAQSGERTTARCGGSHSGSTEPAV